MEDCSQVNIYGKCIFIILHSSHIFPEYALPGSPIHCVCGAGDNLVFKWSQMELILQSGFSRYQLCPSEAISVLGARLTRGQNKIKNG